MDGFWYYQNYMNIISISILFTVGGERMVVYITPIHTIYYMVYSILHSIRSRVAHKCTTYGKEHQLQKQYLESFYVVRNYCYLL